MYVDVILPFRLGPLTYKIDGPITGDIVGCIVLVPFQKRLHYGLVVSATSECPDNTDIKDIHSIGPVFCDKGFISLIYWIAEYYVSYPGMALKCCPFDEAVTLIKRADKRLLKEEAQDVPILGCSDINESEPVDLKGLPPEQIREIVTKLSEDRYRALLVHCASSDSEATLVTYIAKHLAQHKRGIIILVPEIMHIKYLQHTLSPFLGPRLGVFHSQLRVPQRLKFIDHVLSGKIDVVIGTRSAILTPLRSLSLIIVLCEHSWSYKAEESLRYNARDIAVMRGYRGNCPVLLTSISPSLESVFNGRYKRYDYYSLQGNKRCRIRPVLHTFKAQLRSALSAEVLKEAREIMQRGGTFLFVSQKGGYSLLYCTDCGTVARCLGCGSSLLFFEDSKSLVCNHCGQSDSVKLSCGNCKGFNLTPLGGGLERVRAEVEQSLGYKTIIIDNPTGHSGSSWLSLVAKKGTVFRLQKGGFDGVAVVDFDYLLQRADFRATERVFQDIIKIASLLKEKGLLLIQTKDTRSNLIRSLKAYDFKAFYDHELAQRSAAGYPPFMRLARLELFTKGSLPEDTLKALTSTDMAVEIMGPIGLRQTKKGYKMGYRYIIKSLNKRDLGLFLREMERRLRSIKGIKMSIDVDPLDT
jgi:primosomal protein N' (replication factor Y)